MGEFFDAEQGGPLRLELRSVDGRDFTLLRQIGFRSEHYAECFVVPADLRRFTTDLASVPAVFTWLVPKSGDFLPAAVLHDALTRPGAWIGPDLDRHGAPFGRVEADRIFREAMIGLGTGRVRAWLMWAAVTLSTMWHSGRSWTRAALLGVLGTVLVLGVLATLDFFDVWDVLPWMGEHRWWRELLQGALGAVVVPSVLGLTWGPLWRAGVITGTALAFLLHVTAVLALLVLAYQVVERVVSGPTDSRGVRTKDRARAETT
ncbi:DUF1353 domain-containing protein [Ornithinimicrobium cavernae]|uniref:DUF1353 domain-containing protein n=1 Tax=Ornithinimicrobium cavernae TaxID=2666047 RepID=UPI000D690AE3|nr:DUF1353 domain-containing protein [Ornithinimicrobium cavernae]